jgi:hypothetical protein
VPVSVNKEIDVDNINASNAELDKLTGIITWTIELQPGQEKQLSFTYSVKYPKDKRIVLK